MKGLILIYVIAVGAAAAGIFAPIIGMLAYAFFSMLRPQELWGWAGPTRGLSQMVAIPMLIGWAARGFGSWRLGRARGIVICLLGYFFWMMLSTTTAIDEVEAWDPVVERAKIVLPFLVGITMIQSMAHVRALAWIVVVAHGYVSLELNLSYLGGRNLVAEIGYGTMDNNTFAISLVACVGPALFLALHAKRLWQKAVALGSAALIIHTVLLTFSRGGMLALIITGVVCFLIMPKRPMYLAMMIAAVVVTLRFTGPQLVERFNTIFVAEEERDSSASSRVYLWLDCIKAMIDNPLTGVGPGNWRIIVGTFGWPEGKEAHSLWFQTGAELGFPGVTFLLLFYGLTMYRGMQLIRHNKGDPWVLTSGCYVVSSLAGFMVAAQFVSADGLEVAYYTALVGAMTVKLVDEAAVEPAPVRSTSFVPEHFAPAPRAS
jgi:putative inorganic carbon (HCO3(-)) transporter